MEEFYTISDSISAEITEKKSKFIANAIHINSEEEAENIIKAMKKKYHDARHNCYAYRVVQNNILIERSSDDGEPSGTAGAPMLNILQKNELCDVLIIVTRYFGGILLGTGGLVRCYSQASIEAINKSSMIRKCAGYEAEIIMEYNQVDIFKSYCKKSEISIIKEDYFDKFVCKIEMQKDVKGRLMQDINSKKIIVQDFKVLSEKYINKCI